MPLAALDMLCHAVHLFVVFFNLLGWAHPRTRRAHRCVLGITAFCWLAAGPVFWGTLGYCPLTEWHWDVKTARGEGPLPSSYIDYLLQAAGLHFSARAIDTAVGGVFFALCVCTLYLWHKERRARDRPETKSSSV
mgnify:FL=1